MQAVKPKVFLIAKTQLTEEARDWLNFIGAKEYDIPDAEIGSVLTTLAGKRCYKSFQVSLNRNLTKIRDNISEFIKNILRSKHGSVLRHVNYTFGIENVTRVLTAELNRHCAGVAISEGSMRFIREDDAALGYRIPMVFKHQVRDNDGFLSKEQQSREVLERSFQQSIENYRELERIWQIDEIPYTMHEKKELTSAFRRVLTQNIATGGVWTFNLQALRHIFSVRCSAAAEEEIYEVCEMMLKIMLQEETEIFQDFEETADGWQVKYKF